MTTLHILMLLLSSAQAQTPSFKIKNFHSIDPKGFIFRGAQPGSQAGELAKLKIKEVLIVKKQTQTEVDAEVQALHGLGITSDVIPMEWNKPDVKLLCHQVVQAVQMLQDLKRQGKRSFLHCTMGQDRTGTVAGLFRMVDQGWSSKQAFRDEMCANGYSDGAKGKPANIVHDIERSLTPVFLALSKTISAGHLNPAACDNIRIPAQVPTCKGL